MNDQSSNGQLHASSFLQGHNAQYVEQLHARYAADLGSVEPWVVSMSSGHAPSSPALDGVSADVKLTRVADVKLAHL